MCWQSWRAASLLRMPDLAHTAPSPHRRRIVAAPAEPQYQSYQLLLSEVSTYAARLPHLVRASSPRTLTAPRTLRTSYPLHLVPSAPRTLTASLLPGGLSWELAASVQQWAGRARRA